jgi:hypothetical protein
MAEEIKSFLEDHSRTLIISIVTALVTFAATWGSVASKVSDLEHKSDLARQEYVTRAEFNQFTIGMNVRLDDMKMLLLELRSADQRNADLQDARDYAAQRGKRP